MVKEDGNGFFDMRRMRVRPFVALQDGMYDHQCVRTQPLVTRASIS